nr:TetR family transcriptional regulator [uncultured Cohaesibacter sp.]
MASNYKKVASAGRPARISREDIARTALEIGLNNTTLSAIGKHLGVDHSSLYRHIKSRNDILVAAIDLAVEQIDWDCEDHCDWRSFSCAVADRCWGLFMANPGLGLIMRSLDVTPSSVIRVFSKACRRLEDFGFSTQDATLVLDSIMDMTNDSSIGWQHMQSKGQNGAPVSRSLVQAWNEMSEKEASLSPYISIMTDIISGNPKDWWKKKLYLILDGAERMLEKTSQLKEV